MRHMTDELAAVLLVPDGYALIKMDDVFQPGDIVLERLSQHWRGPIPPDSDMVGRKIKDYTEPNAKGLFAPADAVARKKDLSVVFNPTIPTVPLQGWECPRCRKIHGPFVQACECLPPTNIRYTSTTNEN